MSSISELPPLSDIVDIEQVGDQMSEQLALSIPEQTAEIEEEVITQGKNKTMMISRLNYPRIH